MVSSVTKRKAKYLAKFNPTVIGSRATDMKDIAVDSFGTLTDSLVPYEAQVKTDILAAVSPAVPAYQIAAYLGFMRQCFARERKYTGGTLVMELQPIADGWAQKGLNGAALQAIAALFGATLASPH